MSRYPFQVLFLLSFSRMMLNVHCCNLSPKITTWPNAVHFRLQGEYGRAGGLGR